MSYSSFRVSERPTNLVVKILSSVCLLLVLSLFNSENAYSQTIRGIISDANNATPLVSANIVLQTLDEEMYAGTSTDGNGLFVFSSVDEGTYLVKATYIGYEMYEDTITVDWTTDVINLSIELKPGENQLGDIVVTQRGRDADVDVGQQKIDRIDIRRAPTPAGSGDLATYIQTLPGVVATGDRGGNLFIRGGTPSENLTLIDGALVYQPFHIIGFFSVFPEEVVTEADFYAGGFGPKYSGRTSSVLDVKLRNGDLYERHWSASVSPFIGQIYFESPIKKGETALIVSARNSFIDQASSLYGDNQPMNFNSQLIKYNKAISAAGSTCSALFMRTKDEGQLDYEQGDVYRWNNFVLGGKCAALGQQGSVSFFDINLSVSHISNEVGDPDDPERRSSATVFNTQVNMIQVVNKLRLEYGFYTNIRWLDHEINDYFIDLNIEKRVLLGSGAYLQTIIPVGDKIQIKPGVAASWYLFRYGVSLEPRAQVSFQPRGKKNEELSAAWGIYRQPLTGITDFRDAGSAFTVWSTAPYDGEQMTSTHAMIGWRQPLGEKIDYSIEGYMKWTEDLPVSTWSTIAQFNTNVSLADGETQGVDVKLNYDGRIFYSSAGYGYSITEYTTAQDLFSTWFGEPIQKYNPPHDRRHQVNVQAGFDFEKFKINLSWDFGTGLPYTRPLGFDDLIRFEDSLPDVTTEYGTPRVILDKPFTGRMPEFHRLNVSVEKSVDLNTLWMKLQVGAINTYDQRNIFYYDVYTQRRIDQLPFFPYASIKVETKR